MDRLALFVDAGYLLAAGAVASTGKPGRAAVDCNYIALVSDLLNFAKEHSHMSLLRAYWYDGAPDALPTFDQLKVARMPDIKLRLGRLIAGRQKGVDSLIVRDLMTLARERAIASAYLLGGDEDLREGVIAAQDMGVRVVLVGVDPRYAKQAETLVNEADDLAQLEDRIWQPHFQARPQQPSLLPAPSDSHAATTTDTPVASPAPASDSTLGGIDIRPFYELGRDYGARLAAATDSNAKEKLIQTFPRVPEHIDAELLREAARQVGEVDGPEKKRALRAGFWRGFRPSGGETLSA